MPQGERATLSDLDSRLTMDGAWRGGLWPIRNADPRRDLGLDRDATA
jgi:hypothetical protein